jgi:hypothetical protein
MSVLFCMQCAHVRECLWLRMTGVCRGKLASRPDPEDGKQVVRASYAKFGSFHSTPCVLLKVMVLELAITTNRAMGNCLLQIVGHSGSS